MWQEQSPRQIFELLRSFKDMNEDSDKVTEDKDYNIKSKNVKIPEWLKDRIPKGADVYHADDLGEI